MIEFFKEPNLLRLREEILPIISLVVTVGIGENSLLVLVKIHSFNMMFSNERRQRVKIRLDEKLCFRQNFEINLNFSKAPLAIFEYNML